MMSSSIFPTYLLPSIPFRRLLWKTDQTTPKDTANPPSPSSYHGNENDGDNTAVIKTPGFLQGHKSYLRCARCSADLCLTSQIISKGFTGRHGRAYLVAANPSTDGTSIAPTPSMQRSSLPNTVTQQPITRQLVTGTHMVSDITCRFCGSLLGWKYVAAAEELQKYKVGKFILETKRITVFSSWENCDEDGRGNNYAYSCSQKPSEDDNDNDVEFDSQDEEECEDLFSGMWSPWLAARRKRNRAVERHSFG
ncbi:yippee family protein [Histoplasma ohiense]|nr:yippee family protein [Histoplasma ohiense (nom. inval.)]